MEETQSFVNRLEEIKNDGATMSRLRRLDVDGPNFDAIKALHRHLPHDWRRKHFLLIARLFALSKGLKGKGSLGSSLGRACRDPKKSDSFERKMRKIANYDREDLARELPHLINHLKSKNDAPDWKTLLDDVLFWDKTTIERQVNDFFNEKETKDA